MSLHAMIDIETLGTRPGSVIVSVGAVKFDGAGPRPLPFYATINVFSSLMAGLTVDPKTVEWWRGQSQEAQGALESAPALLAEALCDLGYWLNGVDCIWAKGPQFDLVLLEAAYAAVGLKSPWKYNAGRDVRTVLDLAGVETLPLGIQHYAVDDAVNQANAVIKAYELLGKTL